MIYTKDIPDTLKQGDILQNLPKITPNQINFDDIRESWQKATFSDLLPEKANFLVKPLLANGVILSQSCDIRPSFSILFAELKELKSNKLSPNDIEKRIKGIKRIVRDETRIHYFPKSDEIDLFRKPKLLDFKSLFLIPYEFFHGILENYFVARLKNEAQKVLCEKISRFFTRYAFEDVIFLSNSEVAYYLDSISDIDKKIAKKTLEKLRNASDINNF